jgi:ferredoxin, 2Fe-2S
LPKITFIQHNGTERSVEVETGQSIMRAAADSGIPGIVADCGGCMTCATCHVYVPPEWLKILGPASSDEEAMLEIAIDPQANSRLSCQIEITDALDGLVIQIPENQF